MSTLRTTSAAIFAASAIAFASPARAQSPGVDATIDRAVAAWAKVKTVRGTFEQTISNAITGTTVSSRGTYVQERPNRLAIRFSDPARDAIVSDGKALWVYLPSSAPDQVIKRPATERGAVPIDLTGQFLDAPKTLYDISAAGTRTAGGHPAHGLLLVAKKGAAAPVARATVWIDDDDSYIREFESTNANGLTRHIRLSSLAVNAPVSDDEFAFAPPRGARIVDQTRP
jgi:outer membrane lipoprotein carrier protein